MLFSWASLCPLCISYKALSSTARVNIHKTTSMLLFFITVWEDQPTVKQKKNNNTNTRTQQEAIHKTDSITRNVACELSDRFGGWDGHTHSTGGRKKAAVAAACGRNFHGCCFVYASLSHYRTSLIPDAHLYCAT